ncbi:hypothetical protein ACQP1V_35150 [Microtetraspora malaysiensis]|uniref:hypothetical protein n=1 Tax=Microtetraspora malaysiensis TaxID=161358 RepID=UPI003D946100
MNVTSWLGWGGGAAQRLSGGIDMWPGVRAVSVPRAHVGDAARPRGAVPYGIGGRHADSPDVPDVIEQSFGYI